MATRNELSSDQIQVKGDFAWAKIKREFQDGDVSYVDRDDVRYIMGNAREGSTVLPSFKKRVLKELNSVVADVGGGRLAVVKK